jgi:DNA polymerase-3 subunit delta'
VNTVNLEDIIGQDRAIRFLRRAYEKNRIPHALLFTGIPGIGKRSCAFALARLLQCRSAKGIAACGVCPDCRKVDSGNHPDLLFVEPSGVSIKVEQIRAIKNEFALKPFEAERRIAIIADAHTMNPTAANTFLKILEEPPKGSFMVLTAHQASDLLTTIVSRCQHIAFAPLPAALIADRLVKATQAKPKAADIVAVWANGSLGAALAADSEEIRKDRNWLIEEFESLSVNRMSLLLGFAESLSKDKDDLVNRLEMLKVWIRDLVFAGLCPQKIINKDLKERIEETLQRYSLLSLLNKTKIIQEAQNALQKSGNRLLVLEWMLIRLCQEV